MNIFTDLYLDARNWVEDSAYLVKEITPELFCPSRTPYFKYMQPICTFLGLSSLVASYAITHFQTVGVNAQLLALSSITPLLGGLFGIPICVYLTGLTIPAIAISVAKIFLATI
ncbi:hypothetical protein PNK_1993 [Candidatus Protochlamydia naegleriophila]|uniref:Uncharacterized protein n=1 Tax=Candidatus Protochlamydia naegleriophila TaxID=389348 RepID=A0A0U5JEP6_9BACT|nr:hypothetical protein [Candidatus Protochlamydia naegleriophila]CUI17597.1 hypothetical protein PNK_1993 [Candidatus Protochlamydia naegleriophila]